MLLPANLPYVSVLGRFSLILNAILQIQSIVSYVRVIWNMVLVFKEFIFSKGGSEGGN